MIRRLASCVAIVVLGACSPSSDEAASATTVADSTATVETEITGVTSTTTMAPGLTVSTQPSVVSTPPESTVSTTTLAESVDVVTDDGGRVQVGTGSLPKTLDAGFPLPADLAVELSSESDAGLGFSGVTSMSMADATDFYRAGLPEAGYTITGESGTPGVFAILTFERAEQSGQMIIGLSPTGSGSELTLLVNR